MQYIRSFILLLLSLMIFGSCLQTSNPEYPNRVNYTLNVDNVGDSLETGEDRMYVSEFKVLADKFSMHLTDDSILESRPDGMIMSYSDLNEDDELVLGTEIGYEDMNRFSGLDLFIAPPADNANIQDNEFFGDESNYSLVIKGSYNDNSFTYRSNPNFEKNFEFPVVELSDTEPTLVLRVSFDVREILTNDEGNFLNPRDQDNQSVIDSLMQDNVELEAFAANNPFEDS